MFYFVVVCVYAAYIFQFILSVQEETKLWLDRVVRENVLFDLYVYLECVFVSSVYVCVCVYVSY